MTSKMNKLVKLDFPRGSGRSILAWQKGNGTYIAIAGTDQFVGIYNRNGKLIEKIKITGTCLDLAWDRDGDLLGIICDGLNSIVLWEANSSKTEHINPVFNDNLTCILWSKVSQTVAVTSAKGNLTIYDYITSKRIPVLGKHSKSIICGEWNRNNILALGSKDQTVSISNVEGDTLKIITLRGEPSNIKFSKMKSDRKKNLEETLSVLVSNKTLYLIDLQDTDNPIELAFNVKYGSIVTYHWYGDGYILIGFTEGYLISISTHPKEVGKELYQVQNHKELLSDVGLSKISGKVATSGNYTVKVNEIGKLEETIAVLHVEESSVIERISWSEDGRLLAVIASDGCIHLYLGTLPMLSASFNSCVAILTSLNQITVFYYHLDKNQSPYTISVTAEIEPTFLGIGPFHLAVGMNNRIWYYQINTIESNKLTISLIGDQEYLKSIKNINLNGEYISVLFEGKLQLHTVDSVMSKEVGDNVSKMFPIEKNTTINNHFLTNDFLIYSTETGTVHFFYLEDWTEAFTYKHQCGIVSLYPNLDGSRCLIIDTKNEAYLFNAVLEEIISVLDFPTSITKIFWECWDLEKHIFVGCDEKSAYTFIYIKESIHGSIVRYLGSTKLPEKQIPLFLSKGEITLETSSGKLNTIILKTHTAVLIRPTAATLSHPTERLEQDLDKQIALLRFNDAWKTCQLLNKNIYWEKLGKSCLEYFNLEIAIQIYSHIANVSMVWSLELIKDIEDKNLFAAHVAMYLKEFDNAQKLFLESSNPIKALEMRQDLLQWDLALDLAKKLAPKRLPFISYKYGQQLELIGKASEALRQYEQGLNTELNSDLLNLSREGIARCLIKTGSSKKGMAIALEVGTSKILNECAKILENSKKLSDAAELYESVENWDQAASCYIRLKNWSKVGEYASRITSRKIYAQYAKAMEAMGNYKQAHYGYSAAQDYDNVIRLDLDKLNDPQDAIKIIQEHHSSEGSKMIARYFQRNNEVLLAIRFLTMSHCFTDAFRLACDNDQLELYGDVLMDEEEEIAIPEFTSLAKYFDNQNRPALSGKYYYYAKNYQKAIKNLIEGSKINPENEDILSLGIEVAAAAKENSIDEQLIQLLLGDVDGFPKNPKFLFKLHMARKRFHDAAKVAIILASNEQIKGNYRQAHDVLYSTVCELRNNQLKVSNEMIANLALLHSYILVRIHVKLDNHYKAALLLIRVSENIDKFPSHAVQILTSTVIECYRSNLKESAFKYASILMKSNYRNQIDEKYRKKIESVIRKSPRGIIDSMLNNIEPCPYCDHELSITNLICINCKSCIPFCISTGWHITKENLTFCPNCRFPALYNEFIIGSWRKLSYVF
ncbi:WD repeat-containing protein 19 isoform X2 [Daktulosphaira vitifoliae]|uniref:WD repeat-containing protein 19 isoform X2 n=1 Tax=Daktulosphaira vitifoliae TaxID=58002 RepID=UPI0021A99E50|nr:WD repeat-containing protein 19 isoform X2 [Daktulosphaira vitifoliae]